MGVATTKPHPVYDVAHRAPLLKCFEISNVCNSILNTIKTNKGTTKLAMITLSTLKLIRTKQQKCLGEGWENQDTICIQHKTSKKVRR